MKVSRMVVGLLLGEKKTKPVDKKEHFMDVVGLG